MQENLVIVESPAKAKTIEKFLGKDYIVKSSFGHIRDLSKKDLGINIDDEFKPVYEIPGDKKKVVDELTKLAKSKTVWLASDEDREGEAIAWHLTEVLGLPVDQTKRIVFHEITKRAILEAIENPRTVNMDLVNAQQARRILDRLVGFELSPVLWKKVRPSLSAGRVQSVAVRLIVEREREIIAFRSAPYFRVVAQFYAANDPEKTIFKAELPSRFETQAEAEAFLRSCIGATFTVSKAEEKPAQRFPAPPFTTSTLQQEAGRKLGMSVSQTMSVAQHLYEQGLITYMRTDSLRLSEEAIAAAKGFIESRYGREYYPPKARHYKTKGNAQDAHEAIRPSDVNLVPEDIKKDLTTEQFRLYKLIWSRFLACQMASAVYDSVSIEAQSAGYSFRASRSELKFSGFTAVYEEGRDDEEEAPQSPLPDLKEGEPLELKGTKEEQHFTQPPARYSEATLIRALEEKGIGRPSTYAPTISTILNREYVVKEGRALRPTPLGEVVTGLMKDKFQDIVDPTFTAQMEEELDKVEEGTANWKKVLSEFYTDFEAELHKAEQELDGERIKVPDEVSEEICPQCGRNLVIKSGRFGRFLACPGWPECDFTMPLVVEMPGKCPKCGGRLLKRTGKSKKTGKQYTYYCCEHLSNKDESKRCDFMTWDVPVKDNCPVCGWTMFKKSGRGFKKPFCINEACSNFTPEEKRGGWRKKTETSAEGGEAAGETAAAEEVKKPASKKTAAKKTASKASTAKKTTKTAAKKTASAKTTAKKTTAAKSAAKKTAASKKTAAEKAEKE